MPTISWFYGIAIRMFVKDHPPPHFQAVYSEFEANVSIETGEVIDGKLPRRAKRLVREWAQAHREELLTNWQLARSNQALERIVGLDADESDSDQ